MVAEMLIRVGAQGRCGRKNRPGIPAREHCFINCFIKRKQNRREKRESLWSERGIT